MVGRNGLASIQLPIGDSIEILDRGGIVRTHGKSGGPPDVARLAEPAGAVQTIENRLQRRRAVDGQHDRELVAADAARDVAGPEALPQLLADLYARTGNDEAAEDVRARYHLSHH